jgi:hypothetical protein
MRLVEHVAFIGEKRNTFKGLSEEFKDRDWFEDLNVGDQIVLKWFLKNKVGRYGLGPCDNYRWWALVNIIMYLY